MMVATHTFVELLFDRLGAGGYTKARELYQYVIFRWPDDEHAMGSHAGIARTSLALLARHVVSEVRRRVNCRKRKGSR
jgi:hypothetical protein